MHGMVKNFIKLQDPMRIVINNTGIGTNVLMLEVQFTMSLGTKKDGLNIYQRMAQKRGCT